MPKISAMGVPVFGSTVVPPLPRSMLQCTMKLSLDVVWICDERAEQSALRLKIAEVGTAW